MVKKLRDVWSHEAAVAGGEAHAGKGMGKSQRTPEERKALLAELEKYNKKQSAQAEKYMAKHGTNIGEPGGRPDLGHGGGNVGERRGGRDSASDAFSHEAAVAGGKASAALRIAKALQAAGFKSTGKATKGQSITPKGSPTYAHPSLPGHTISIEQKGKISTAWEHHEPRYDPERSRMFGMVENKPGDKQATDLETLNKHIGTMFSKASQAESEASIARAAGSRGEQAPITHFSAAGQPALNAMHAQLGQAGWVHQKSVAGTSGSVPRSTYVHPDRPGERVIMTPASGDGAMWKHYDVPSKGGFGWKNAGYGNEKGTPFNFKTMK